MTFPFKKAIVTGGAGFIGSHIVEELLNLGVETVSIDNYQTGDKRNLATFKKNKLFKEVDCDVTDYPSLKKQFKGVDIVFHEAASKKTICLKDPRRDLEINAKGTFNLLELSRDFGVKKFVHASSGSVYGEAKIFPQKEDHPLDPVSYYGVSKLAGERYVDVFNHLYGLDTTVLRYFHVYGTRQESSDYGGVIAIFNRRLMKGEPPIIFGDGTQQRSFTYVKDVVKANLLVAQKKEAKGEVYNCASGINITINEMAKMVLKEYGSGLKPIYKDWTPGDIKVFNIDNSKIKKLGLKDFTPFDKGLKETVEWYRESLAE